MAGPEFQRMEMLVGKGAMEKLASSSVLLFGLGGVGSYVSEALARSGVGRLALVDNDTVGESNINRQLVALHSTLGKPKTEVAAKRARDINPSACVEAYDLFFTSENADMIDFEGFSYVVDAIDTVSSKLEIIERAVNAGVPVISSMGTGNKLDPTRLEVSDIGKTSVCPLAKVMRRELRRRGIDKLKVVYSREEPVKPCSKPGEEAQRRPVPGSTAFVPAAAGLIIAGEVVRDIISLGI